MLPFGLDKYLLPAAGCAIAASLAFGSWEKLRADRLDREITGWTDGRGVRHPGYQEQIADLKDAFNASEQARKDEHADAQDSYNGLQSLCKAERGRALVAGRAIEKVVNAPAPKPGDPRGIVGANVLRDVAGEVEPGAH